MRPVQVLHEYAQVGRFCILSSDNIMKKQGWLMRQLDKRLTTDQFSAKQIIDLYVPMMLDQFSIYVIGILSSAMVSASSEEAISAVSLVNSLAFMVTALFTAMSTGGTVLVAQAKGRGDPIEIRRACGQIIMLTTLIGTLATLILYFFSDPIVHLMFGQADELIVSYGITYLKLYGLSFMPFAIFNSISCCFRGIGEARVCLFLTIVINVMHLIMSFVLINICDMGIAGSGLSFIIARVVGAIAAIVVMFFTHNIVHVRFKDLFRLEGRFLLSVLRLAMPFAIEQILFNGGQLLTNSYVANLPTESIAANGIAASANNMLFIAAFSLQNLIMTVCGQCIGAKNYDLAKQYVKQLIKIGRILIILNILIIAPVMPLMMLLYQPSAAVEPVVYQLLGIGALALAMLWADAYLIPACLRAAGDAMFTTAVCLGAMWVARVAVGYLLTITCGFGIYAVWAINFLEYAIRAVIFHVRFRGTKWRKM